MGGFYPPQDQASADADFLTRTFGVPMAPATVADPQSIDPVLEERKRASRYASLDPRTLGDQFAAQPGAAPAGPPASLSSPVIRPESPHAAAPPTKTPPAEVDKTPAETSSRPTGDVPTLRETYRIPGGVATVNRGTGLSGAEWAKSQRDNPNGGWHDAAMGRWSDPGTGHAFNIPSNPAGMHPADVLDAAEGGTGHPSPARMPDAATPMQPGSEMTYSSHGAPSAEDLASQEAIADVFAGREKRAAAVAQAQAAAEDPYGLVPAEAKIGYAGAQQRATDASKAHYEGQADANTARAREEAKYAGAEKLFDWRESQMTAIDASPAPEDRKAKARAAVQARYDTLMELHKLGIAGSWPRDSFGGPLQPGTQAPPPATP